MVDNFLCAPAAVAQARDLLEVIEDRSQLRSAMVASQLPVEMWHDAPAGPTLADAILDRLVHNAYRITLKGPSMRGREPEAIPVG